MNILVIGGSGPLGGYTALHLQSEGHEVTISSRRKPAAHSPLSALKWVKGNYLEESFSRDDLDACDWQSTGVAILGWDYGYVARRRACN